MLLLLNNEELIDYVNRIYDELSVPSNSDETVTDETLAKNKKNCVEYM